MLLGANGLGKTTLVNMLYRLLTGPYDIPALRTSSELGTASLKVTPLRGRRRRTFSHRVADGGASATARLEFDVGSSRVVVERYLRDLKLRSLRIGDSELAHDEGRFQREMRRLANVSTFGDWILLLRYIIFYFEDRRSLVWDPDAQRQLLRILFLDPSRAREWTDREREILEEESRVRNLRAATTREARELTRHEEVAADEPRIRQQLRKLEERQRIDNESFEAISLTLPELESQREESRLRFFTLEQNHESHYRELERAKLHAVSTSLPQYADSARYILAQLLAETKCLVCGTSVPQFARAMETRIHGDECIICGSHMAEDSSHDIVDISGERVTRLIGNVDKAEDELQSARANLQVAEGEYEEAIAEIRQLQARIARRTVSIDALLVRLPAKDVELHEQRQELSTLRGRVELLQRELDDRREAFDGIVETANHIVLERADDIKASFEHYAREFLFEECELIWSPRSARLGQSGRRFQFPAFELSLGGSDFGSVERRSGPDSVSESQREFIDLSFRMALVAAAEQRGVASVVLDAPESSLDSVFVSRAARVLAQFGDPDSGNRLVVTSNLTDGKLIPELLIQASGESDESSRVVDLLRVAVPTAAIRLHRDEYEKARDDLLARAGLEIDV